MNLLKELNDTGLEKHQRVIFKHHMLNTPPTRKPKKDTARAKIFTGKNNDTQ